MILRKVVTEVGEGGKKKRNLKANDRQQRETTENNTITNTNTNTKK